MHSSWKDIGRMVLSGFLALGAVLFWVGVATEHDAGRWFMLLFALICTGLLLRIFGRVERRGVRGSKRYMQLDRLDKEWQARAERGEIPRTTPGGPKVWQDELEPDGSLRLACDRGVAADLGAGRHDGMIASRRSRSNFGTVIRISPVSRSEAVYC